MQYFKNDKANLYQMFWDQIMGVIEQVFYVKRVNRHQIIIFNGCQMLPFFGLPWFNLKIGQNGFYDFYRFWKPLKNATNCLNCEHKKDGKIFKN